ncbi:MULTISPECIES: sugar transferase [Flagellimonas]|uniref:Sugar transferase n=1 Tax=Flagellimonas hadalis TaxID=2597517 RepID=A0A5N5IWK7_9FLAO|nr:MULTISPECIES: sugar transferase [Allomuricauda]KAB5491503.1 sugar transferase [Allomuricauda hadalis]RUA12043.1 MAG: sugar transferase [Flavobacteriia bacterium]
MYAGFFKRFIDAIIAFILICISLPILILLIILLYFSNGGKPFFFQNRPGKNGKVFKIIKFKTMNDRTDSEGNLLPNKDRITKIGGIVRKSSLDEIPQLFNVLKGDMSLIGPRPLLVDYLKLYTTQQSRRHEVRPGITGWAQVNGRNAISWEKKFELDVWYVDHVSLLLDLKIMWLTVLKVVKSEGISASAEVTMERFQGTA